MFKWLANILNLHKDDEDDLTPEQWQVIGQWLEAHRKTIDDYRDQFKTAPIGHWSQAVGTFSQVMDEVWTFHANHTGEIVETGPFGGEMGSTLFEWKEVADFTIACKITKWPYEDEISATDEAEPDEEPQVQAWDIIHYDFKLVPTDFGELIAMCEITSDGSFSTGFWESEEPLMNNDDWEASRPSQ